MNRVLLTPFFLDRSEPQLRSLVREDWALNEPRLPPGTLWSHLAVLNEGIAGFTERWVRQGDRPVSIAGDCCAAIGAIAGLQRAGVDASLLWLDAHGDFNTPDTSPSGFVGGMPLAMLAGRGEQTILRELGTRPLDEAAIVLCDARDLDPLERDALSSSRVVHLASLDQLRSFDFGTRPVHVHIDADVIDPREAPAVLYPAAGGPSVARLETVLRDVARRSRALSVSLAAWALDRDGNGATGAAVWRVIGSVLGAGVAPS